MESLIQHIVEGQKKLEWAVERQMTSAQADRDTFKDIMKSQMDTLMRAAEDQPQTAGGHKTSRGISAAPNVSLQKYVPGEDPDAFLLNFERAARASGWPIGKWLFFLAPLLSGEAQAAYQVANAGGVTPYEEVKAIILDHLEMDSEAYRLRFRKEKGVPGDNPETLFFKLKLVADKWLKPADRTKEEIMNSIYLEQLLEALPFSTQ